MLYLQIPKDINIKITENWIEIKGPLGEVKKKKSPTIKLIFKESEQKLFLLNTLQTKISHFYLSMINKLIWGVWKGYSIKLNIIGVGYKVFIEDKKLDLKIGFSHLISYTIPQNINIKLLNKKLLTLIISGKDFQTVTQVASEIKALKPVDCYKGKGIKYSTEIVKLKEGKKTNV
jgi:large subunit ribosomal protein L6